MPSLCQHLHLSAVHSIYQIPYLSHPKGGWFNPVFHLLKQRNKKIYTYGLWVQQFQIIFISILGAGSGGDGKDINKEETKALISEQNQVYDKEKCICKFSDTATASRTVYGLGVNCNYYAL